MRYALLVLLAIEAGCVLGEVERAEGGVEPEQREILESVLGQFEDRSTPGSISRLVVGRSCDGQISGIIQYAGPGYPRDGVASRITAAPQSACPSMEGAAGELEGTVVVSAQHGTDDWQPCTDERCLAASGADSTTTSYARLRHTPWSEGHPETLAVATLPQASPSFPDEQMCQTGGPAMFQRVLDDLTHLYCLGDPETGQGTTHLVRGTAPERAGAVPLRASAHDLLLRAQ